MRKARLADGRVLTFPDDTSDEVIQARVKQLIAGGDPSQSLQVPQEATLGQKIVGGLETATTIASGIPAGLAGGLSFIPAAVAGGVEAATTNQPIMTGATEAGLAVKEDVEQALTFEPRTEAGQQFTQAVAEKVAPVSQAIEELRETLGEAEFASTDGKEGVTESQRAGRAAIAGIIPDILLEATALLGGKSLLKLSKSQARKRQSEGEKLTLDADEILNPAEEVDLQGAASVIKQANTEDIARLVNADPKTLDALEDLGLGEQALASYSSQNPQFRAIEMGLASVDASDLNIQQKNFITDLSQKADDIIIQGGGDLDKAALSETIKSDMFDVVDNMYKAESEIYDNMRTKLPPKTKINPENTISLIEGWATEVGGIKNLDSQIIRLHNSLKPSPKTTKKIESSTILGKKITTEIDEGLPAFGLLNKERREIGQQLGKKGNTKFKDTEIGTLKALYSSLKRDQKAAVDDANDPSLLAMQDSADRLTFQRKRIENDMTELFGKGLDKELINTLGASVKGLEKGNLQRFKKTITQIPENQRGAAIMSAMNNVFKGTAATKHQLGDAQFARFWTSIQRQPSVKTELFKHIPKDSRKALNSLGEVVVSVNKAHQDKITTGRISEFLDDRSGVLGRLAKNLAAPVVAVAARASGGELGSAVVAKEFADLMANSTDQAKAANKMLSQGEFKSLLKDAVRGGVADGKEASGKLKSAEKKFEQSKSFQRWANILEREDVQAFGLLSRVGVVNYLLKPRQEQAEQ